MHIPIHSMACFYPTTHLIIYFRMHSQRERTIVLLISVTLLAAGLYTCLNYMYSSHILHHETMDALSLHSGLWFRLTTVSLTAISFLSKHCTLLVHHKCREGTSTLPCIALCAQHVKGCGSMVLKCIATFEGQLTFQDIEDSGFLLKTNFLNIVGGWKFKIYLHMHLDMVKETFLHWRWLELAVPSTTHWLG